MKTVNVPCVVGDKLYTHYHVNGDPLKSDATPDEVTVVFVGLNDNANYGNGFINVLYPTGRQLQFFFADIGVKIFLTPEEARLTPEA